MFLKQSKNVTLTDSPDIIFTLWDCTRYNFGHSVAGIVENFFVCLNRMVFKYVYGRIRLLNLLLSDVHKTGFQVSVTYSLWLLAYVTPKVQRLAV